MASNHYRLDLSRQSDKGQEGLSQWGIRTKDIDTLSY